MKLLILSLLLLPSIALSAAWELTVNPHAPNSATMVSEFPTEAKATKALCKRVPEYSWMDAPIAEMGNLECLRLTRNEETGEEITIIDYRNVKNFSFTILNVTTDRTAKELAKNNKILARENDIIEIKKQVELVVDPAAKKLLKLLIKHNLKN